MRRWITLLCLLLMLPIALTLAQSDPFQFSRINIDQGLSNNQINCIFKDRQGFMWFGTMSGLNRYDGYGFKIFRHSLKDTMSLNDDFVTTISEGPDNKLWVQTRSGFTIYDPATETFDQHPDLFLSSIGITGGQPASIVKDLKGNFWFFNDNALFLYEPLTKKTTTFIHRPGDHFSIGAGIISAFREDRKGNYWILFRDGNLEMMEGISKKIFSRTNAIQAVFSKDQFYYRLFIDRENDLWIYPSNNPKGIAWYRPQTNTVQVFNKEVGPARLNTNIINGLAQDDDGLIWIATDHGGLNIIDKKNSSVQYITNKDGDIKSLSQNSVISLYNDNSGTMWAGTFKKGINYFHKSAGRFPLYRHQSANSGSLGYDDVNRFVEDAKGNLWIGTNGGGLIYFDRATGKFTSFLHNPTDAASLSNDVIIGLCIDHQNKLWIGTYFGGLDCYDGKKFTHYRHNDTDTTSLSDDRVWDILEDSKKNLWVATLGGGVNLFNQASNTFSHIKSRDVAGIKSNFVFDFLEDKQGNTWMATALGIDVLESSNGKFIHYQSGTENGRLSNNNVLSLFQDSRGIIWACTRDGLNVFDEKTKTFSVFRTENGLPDNAVLNLVEDNAGKLWASTPNGLSAITVVQTGGGNSIKISCKNYDNADGLQGREFNVNAAYRTAKGEMVFGGGNGFNLFNPAHIVPEKTKPVLAFTGFELYNKPLGIGEEINGYTVLTQSISQTKELNLRYNQNIISIEFAALNYTNTDKIIYAYKLEGFNEDWIITDGKQRKATYTNLDPGNYIFKVKASGDDIEGNETPITLIINIAPPFWKTTWAYILYGLLFIAALVIARRLVLQRAKRRFNLEQERQEAQRLHEMDLMKIRFFTNVSHEFRTPISLILSPVEKMMQQSEEPGQKKQYQLIHRNARRLLNMVNQLLDFRKMEVKELKLNPTQGDIIRFIKEISHSFTDLAENKHIRFSFNTTIENMETLFDQDKLERILFNLLSNAFKFTRPDGFVSVEIDYKTSKPSGEKASGILEIKVQDTGIGIEADKQGKIFERFFQNEVPGSIVNQGSGIGLAITKEFVKLHGGTITLESEPEKGSCFTVWLPIVEIEKGEEELLPVELQPEVILQTDNVETEETVLNEKPIAGKTTGPKKPVLLLVEDNDDFRFYLKDNLNTHFTIVEAINGKEGWQKALALHPVLVISDISMPEMNGIDLCKKIKTDPRTRQIPIILLTALTGEEKLLEGLETGANDYMTKPFNFEVLLSRVKNILQQQDSLKKTLKKQVPVETTDIEMPSPDETFVQQAVAAVEKKMDNPEFSVEDLSREMYMSRVGLYKKLLTLTGKTPIEFIRSIRLQRAAQLLEKSNMNITEVAYEVGFNQPRYFAKYFKQEFGVLPSAYLAAKNQEGISE